jgi:DNA-binding response OmpR family regulator
MQSGDRPVRILVIEDSPTQARVLQGILSSHGFEVETAYDGPSGFERFCRSRFDLVVSDVIMPGISGYELCKKIKQKSNGSTTPVILLTALTELKDLIDGLRSGADNFISKPVNPDFLIARIHALVDENGQTGQSICDPKTGVCFLDQSFIKSLDRKKILDYLVSTFDDFLRLRDTQSQKKLAEAQRYFRLLRQQEVRASKVVEDIKTLLEEQDHAMSSLISGEQGNLEKGAAETITMVRKRNQSVGRLVSELGAMFRELELVTSEQ